jgi:DNA-binding transcriptional MerR regulator
VQREAWSVKRFLTNFSTAGFHPCPAKNEVLTLRTKMAKLTQISFQFIPDEQQSSYENYQNPIPPPQLEESKPVEEISVTMQPEKNIEEPKKIPQKRGRLSLKEIDVNADLIQIPPDDILFQKQYYSIGEVAKWFRVNQSLIRYWETEFDILQPRKNRKGDRFFRPIDVKNLLLIHDLLRRRKFTLEGAKEFLKKSTRVDEKFEMIQSLEKIKTFFLELKATL